MSEATSPVVFFDIGQTLGAPVFSPPPDFRLLGLDVFPVAREAVADLHGRGVRLGIISNTGGETLDAMNAVLEASEILRFFEGHLLIYSADVGLTKDTPEIFHLAAQRAGLSDHPELCVFVGENRQERQVATDAGFRVVPHPSLVEEVIAGSPLRYVRISVPGSLADRPWRSTLHATPTVPVHVTGDGGREVYAITSRRGMLQLSDLRFEVAPLGEEGMPATTDLFLLRDDRSTRTGFLAADGQAEMFAAGDDARSLLSTIQDGLLVALPAAKTIDDYHFVEAEHGHTQRLVPEPNLLRPFGRAPEERAFAWAEEPAVEPDLSDREIGCLEGLTGELIESHLWSYTGLGPASAAAMVSSRHVRHPDNAVAVEALARQLTSLGGGSFRVSLHRFVHEGIVLHNVEAELAGIDDEVGGEVVMLTAHLDSTAAFTPGGFDAASDPAPGVDDDGSGMAAVLAAAEVLAEIAQGEPPRRTFRFALFNAEEVGLLGSQAYAGWRASQAAPIVAVFQMDMIGFRGANEQPPRPFEIHVGYSPSSDVEERSRRLAERVEGLVGRLSPGLASPQIYPRGGVPDPAERRSDHGSFQQHGYAACAITEDFFLGPQSTDPAPQPNPHYHQASDVAIDSAYAADIARVALGAALVTAKI